MLVLAGDIGGTHTRLALVEIEGGTRIVTSRTYSSAEAAPYGLVRLVEEFFAAGKSRPARACFAVAGPVLGDEVSGTNLPWSVSARELGRALGLPHFRVMNDFEAVARGLPLLEERDLVTLQVGEPDPKGTIALIGAGTGLGQGFIARNGPNRIHASEGGHATFAAETPGGWALDRFLADRFGHVSWERVVSGPGLIATFEFLLSESNASVSSSLRSDMAEGDPAAAISRHALAGSDPFAVEALDLFTDAYGAQAGNLALTVLATGGVYLAGGIAPRIIPKLREPVFLNAFRRKGRLGSVLERIPVRVIMNRDVGLLGAASILENAS